MDYRAFSDEMQKIAKVDWPNFKEGLKDEGIPLAGATLGAGIGKMYGKGLVGAALGYSAGGLTSLARSKLKGEEPSMSRKLLAAGALGYGVGGLAHLGTSRLAAARLAPTSTLRQVLTNVGENAPKKLKFLHGVAEEALPALGATVATGIATGVTRDKRKRRP